MKNNQFILRQINDALFPIGAYAHSYGLETYIQKNIVFDHNSAASYIYNYLFYNQCYNDFLMIKLIYHYSKRPDLARQIDNLDEIATATKTPSEIRDASYKLGSRFVKAASCFELQFENEFYQYYAQMTKKHYSLIYPLFCFSLGISYEDALSYFLYAQTSALITTCVKSVPLSQYDGQKLLYACHAHFFELMDHLSTLTIDDYGLSTPGFDIRCMQHEKLYSRIYMS